MTCYHGNHSHSLAFNVENGGLGVAELEGEAVAVDGVVEHPRDPLDQLKLHLLLPDVLRVLLFIHIEVQHWALGGGGVQECPGREE